MTKHRQVRFHTGSTDSSGNKANSRASDADRSDSRVSDSSRYDPSPGRRWLNLSHQIVVSRVKTGWRAKCRNCGWKTKDLKAQRSAQVAGYRHRFSDQKFL